MSMRVLISTSLLILTSLVGCTAKPVEKPAKPAEKSVDAEAPVREKFSELQSAIKSGEGNKIWKLLDTKTQAEAERTAKEIQNAVSKANPEGKSKLEETLGLSGADLAKMSSEDCFKLKRFLKKYHEVPESKIEKIEISGDAATLHFLEPDGDHEKLILTRQGNEWRFWLAIPKLSQPAPD